MNELCKPLSRATSEDACGRYLVRQKGSHKQYKHPHKIGLVTISGHKPSDEIAIGTLNSILKQAQIK